MEYQEKRCKKCKEIKLIEFFSERKDGKDGINSWCKVCIKERKRRYCEINAERISQEMKEYYKKNKDKIFKRENAHREKHLQYLKEYYKNNIDLFKEYRQKNVSMTRGYVYKRRALRINALSEKIDLTQIFESYNWICGICGKKINKKLKWPQLKSMSLDHIVPLSKGGNHVYNNVQPAHLGCNLSKGNKINNIQLAM